ncbi:DUF2057 family protein [Vibrio sp. SM6]|uniref:UPF0319 protein HGP28_04025 n=1 Tax=Vibrio agarilyticus TaxID=2726741 RepID=A0A7X8TNY9_9VIBR|nr:DUF2057 family protein [Vibrio agarilyticus]NLS12060.1 DUF2057 family protein [Vibrio agarilyticus]
MNLLKPITCLCALALSGFAAADVKINLPEGVDLLVVNDARAEVTGGLFASESSATLPNGSNQIVFRFEQFFSSKNDSESVISDAIIATFNATDTELDLVVPNFRTVKQAKANMADLDWQLVDTSGQVIAVTQDKLVKKGLQIGRDYVREAADYNRKGGIATLARLAQPYAISPQANVIATTTEQTAPTQSSAMDSTAEEMLHFWYNKADEATRARFKAFVNQQ